MRQLRESIGRSTTAQREDRRMYLLYLLLPRSFHVAETMWPRTRPPSLTRRAVARRAAARRPLRPLHRSSLFTVAIAMVQFSFASLLRVVLFFFFFSLHVSCSSVVSQRTTLLGASSSRQVDSRFPTQRLFQFSHRPLKRDGREREITTYTHTAAQLNGHITQVTV